MKKILIALLALVLSFENASANNLERSQRVKDMSFSETIKKAADSVVSVYVNTSKVNLKDNIQAAMYGEDFINDMVQSIDPDIQIKSEKALGSGVIVSKEGMVVTNSHIVSDALDIKIVTDTNKTYDADIIALDKSLDLAILQIRKTEDSFKAIEFANSDSVLVGDRVFALGNPFGVGQSASMGIVSAIGRGGFNLDGLQYLIQTDAAINPGNSGGALIDVDGKLIGINSAIFSKTEGFSGVSFSIPSNSVKFAVNTLKTNGAIQRPWLGAIVKPIDQNLKTRLNLKSSDGVYVTEVLKNSPAAKAGVKVGDIITKLKNRTVKDVNTYDSLISTFEINSKIMVTVIRNGAIIRLNAVLGLLNKRLESDKFIIRGANILSGLVVEKLSPELNYMLGQNIDTKGIAVIDRPQKVSDLNIQVGDIILEVNKVVIKDLESLQKALEQQAPYGWNFKLLRAGKEIKIFVK